MAFNLTFSLGRLFGRNEKITTAKLNAVIKGITASFSGTVGHADMTPGAVKADITTPDAYSYIGVALSGATYVGTWSPAPSGYTDGLWLCFKANSANTGAANLNANGLGAKPIRKWGGQVLETGDIVAGQMVTVRYNSTIVGGGCFEIVGGLGQPYGDGYRFGVSVFDAVNKYVVTIPDRVVAYTGGLTIAFYADATNLGSTVVNVNGLGNANLWGPHTGVPLVAGDIQTGQLVVAVHDGHGGFQVVSPLGYRSAEAVIGASKNLVVMNNAGTPNTKVDVTADEVVLKEASTGRTVLVAPSVTINCATTGANGLDAGSLANATWYYVYVIYNGTTLGVAGLMSTSATAPTLPSGYTYKALVGSVLTDGSAHFWSFVQEDRDVWLTPQVVFTAQAGQTSYGSQSLASFIPPTIAKWVSGTMGGVLASGVVQGMAVAADSSGTGECVYMGTGSTSNTVSTFSTGAPFRVPVVTSQTVYWKTNITTASAFRMVVTGFRI